MVNKCYVTGCTNNRDKYCPEDVGIFKFPKDGLLLRQWIDFCGSEDPDKKLPQSAGICTEHFEPEMLIPPIKHWANRKVYCEIWGASRAGNATESGGGRAENATEFGGGRAETATESGGGRAENATESGGGHGRTRPSPAAFTGERDRVWRRSRGECDRVRRRSRENVTESGGGLGLGRVLP
ncbi:hypothetical protein pipiens_013736 [Culex pipiens pipiens]|uniref:THAP-type domain-containing protein n=1 Tax=Culex pipiens pipiens TaxID=38569 RepID=A0ABD1CXH3_CULPP